LLIGDAVSERLLSVTERDPHPAKRSLVAIRHRDVDSTLGHDVVGDGGVLRLGPPRLRRADRFVLRGRR